MMKSKHSLLIVPISRSQNAFAWGARTGVLTTLSPREARVASSSPENVAWRS
jgi:hypothetical protein